MVKFIENHTDFTDKILRGRRKFCQLVDILTKTELEKGFLRPLLAQRRTTKHLNQSSLVNLHVQTEESLLLE
jgi:hypothetical protein